MYKVFSVYKIENEDYYIKTEFKNDNEFEDFIKTLKKKSIIRERIRPVACTKVFVSHVPIFSLNLVLNTP